MKKFFFLSMMSLVTLMMHAQSESQDYVDLGLPSGTLWQNSENGSYTYYKAIEEFGDKLPTKEQYEELMDKCEWIYIQYAYVGVYRVTGPNGNSIELIAPQKGESGDGYLYYEGGYWTRNLAPDNNNWAFIINFIGYPHTKKRYWINCCASKTDKYWGVRLVKSK